jgi:predicted RNA-binding Zn ribbon-like protein
MMHSRAGSLSLVGGVLALDFANTASGRETSRPIEHLQTAGHIVDWAMHARSIDAATAERCRAAMARHATAPAKLLRDALRLREAVYRIGSAVARGETPAPADLGILKALACASVESAELAPVPGNGYAFDFSAGPVESTLLGPVAWSAVDLLAKGPFERIRQCPGPDCGWLFFDGSKNSSRRWCDMAVCGNRSKAKRHRERSRD